MKDQQILMNELDLLRHKILALGNEFPVDLFLHAAEDEGRTQDPTEHRKRKAREEEGRVFHTAELPQSLEILLGATVIVLLSVYYWNTFKDLMIRYLENPEMILISDGNVQAVLFDAGLVFIKLLMPVAVVGVLAVTLSTMLQTGFHFSTKVLQPNFGKMMPSWENLIKKTIFSRAQVINLVKVLVKMVLLILVTYLFLFFKMDEMIQLVHAEPVAAFVKTNWMVYELVAAMSFVLLALAIPDYFIQKNEYEEQLKMSRDEVKREYRELEGDPQIKARQRERARELSNRTMLANVKKADVVITNPTHYAVAIEYDPQLMDAPRVIAKGADLLALRIRELAKENDIAILENRPVARGLYEMAEVGQMIPAEFFSAVAEIIAMLDKFKRPSVA